MEIGFFLFIQFVLVGMGCFQQGEGIVDVGVNEFVWIMDGMIYMVFGGEVQDGVWMVLQEQCLYLILIVDVILDENMVGIIFQVFEIFKIVCICQFVEIDDRFVIGFQLF